MEFYRGDWPAGEVPEETTGFVGRRAELIRAGCALQETRLVTLTGVGGVGKTRLALRAAAGLRATFPDGVWLVELSPVPRTGRHDTELLALIVMEALRLADQTTRPATEVVAEWLADKRLLLLLDCCEHLTAPCADLVGDLLSAAPGLRILATSRQPLSARDERVMTVPPLPVPRPGRPQGGPGQEEDAVALFLQRAADAAPGLATDAAARAVVAEICVRLEGLPLAIELAAARLPELTLDQLRADLHSRFEVLAADPEAYGDGEPRHQALRTTIGWSHELCAPLERLLWARLSVFAGGCDREAAQAVCAGGPLSAEEVPRLLDGLVAKSLLQRRAHVTGTVRYAMLDTVREFGADWLAGLGEAGAIARRHRDHFLALARRADAEWVGPHQVAWCWRAVVDHANFRAALDHCLTEGEEQAALELGGALWFSWFACGYARAGRHYLDRALARWTDPGPARSRAVWACGVAAVAQGDAHTTARLGKEFRVCAEAAGSPAMLTAAAYLDGLGLLLHGQPAEAAAVFDATDYTRAHSSAYAGARLMVWATRGFVHVALGEFADAAAAADALRTECGRRGERWARAWATTSTGWRNAASADRRRPPCTPAPPWRARPCSTTASVPPQPPTCWPP
ncbi:ATP-binding protein [Streptomyces minutiscleroticus]|uniref:ATP-binding protein n=1 Tax=Streptomyces minutiscleroticus TaxID=68238 RepID=UPI003322162D